jgi:DNA-binding beta-propeller fold protein YncE
MRAGRLTFLLVAAFTSAAVLIGPDVGSAAAGLPAGSGAAGTGPGSVLWTSDHAGDGHAVAVDPKGGMVFVAGSGGLTAYDAGTGAQLWDNAAGAGLSVAVTQDGHAVFAINPVRNSGGNWDFSTTAFDTATGKRLWVRRYNGRANGDDRPVALAVSPGGGTVFVTGTSKGKTSGFDYATIAYASATGRQLWASRYNGHGRSTDSPAAIAVRPRGGAVFITGTSAYDFATVGYAAATGATLWTKRYDRAGGHDFGSSVAVSPDGRRVFVTGASEGRTSAYDFATLAYSAVTGARLWARRYGHARPAAVLVSPLGGTVLVAGTSERSRRDTGYLAVTYSAATGRTERVIGFGDADFETVFADAAAISQDGSSLYLTGSAESVPAAPAQALTVALKIATGALSWRQVTEAVEVGRSVAVSPDGGTVYVVVEHIFGTTLQDYTTTAFRA